MHTRPDRRPARWGLVQAWLVLAGLAAGCGGRGTSDPGVTPGTGELAAKPGGGYYLADTHHSGSASRVRLLEIGWGRLVDVHDIDAQGVASPVPVLRDFVIGEGVVSDGSDLLLETNPVTHDSRLIVLRPRDAPDTGSGSFTSILLRAGAVLSPVLPKHDDGSSSPPFSFVARNATLVLHFDDLLEDGLAARQVLTETVRLTTGYPPTVPQMARTIFDPSHGGVVNEAFHSTRVLVDFTISEREALELPGRPPVNAVGAPASSRFSEQANASLHLPTRIDESAGRFVILTNLAGRGLELQGPREAATRDLVRGFRTGNSSETNAGFLLDFEAPRIIGTWEIALEQAADDPAGPAGYGFVAGLRFSTPCRAAPRRGDNLELAGELYEVREQASAPDFDGRVSGLRLLRLAEEPLPDAGALLGLGRLFTPYRQEANLHATCWLSLSPPAGAPPFDDVSSEVRVGVRFSEPMDPDTFRAFDTFRLLRGIFDDSVRPQDLVVGSVRVQSSLQEIFFEPRLPLENQLVREYVLEVVDGPTGVKDLAGGQLVASFDRAEFFLGEQLPVRNGGFALRFEDVDELDPPGFGDVRGQITHDLLGGVLRPRATAFGSFAADRTIPIPGRMQPFALGVQTPLSSFGSKLQAVWRHADFGFLVRDESFHNLDVIGLSWSPLSGRLVTDFFPDFELRLAHARYTPDESGSTGNGPLYPASGLDGSPFEFARNVLNDPRGGQVVVHPRSLGYRVRPADMTLSSRGTPFLAFPWNHSGAPETSFTWRDTAVLAKGGLRGPGVPLDIECGPPLQLDVGIGSFAPAGQVPSVGLPLLWEVRCFPSSGSLGLNSLDILLPLPGWAQPNFRAFSTGGIDQSGRPVLIDPDLALVPSGGFNPSSTPPGRPTPLTADNSFYIGQIDTVVRISRAVTIWIDTGLGAPRFVAPVIEPRSQIGASALVVEYRGADTISDDAGSAPFDAARLDPYGDFKTGTIDYHGDGSWSEDIGSADGARYLQVRFTFVNDTDNQLSAELDSLGIAFEE
jgi:hypothetical protein